VFEDDRSYYRHRAELETERARSATVPTVRRVHQQLAEAYLGKLACGMPVKVGAS
jgi:hypothetical protein